MPKKLSSKPRVERGQEAIVAQRRKMKGLPPKPVRPLTAWAVVGPDGVIDNYTISTTRREAIHHASLPAWGAGGKEIWAWKVKQGYRCIKVRIEDVK